MGADGFPYPLADNVKTILGLTRLNIQDEKTKNALIEHKITPSGIYRRQPPISLKGTQTRQRGQLAVGARESRAILELKPFGSPPIPKRAHVEADGFAYPPADNAKILGLIIDN